MRKRIKSCQLFCKLDYGNVLLGPSQEDHKKKNSLMDNFDRSWGIDIKVTSVYLGSLPEPVTAWGFNI